MADLVLREPAGHAGTMPQADFRRAGPLFRVSAEGPCERGPGGQLMDRQYYIGLADSGLRMPIGTDLVLHERADAGDIVLDGRRLGQITAEAAKPIGTPLAVPLMDLRLEKADLLDNLRRAGSAGGCRSTLRRHLPKTTWLS